MTVTDKWIDVAGLPVHYLEAGVDNGRALLLLHGGIGDARANWHEAILPLAERFHVFAPDLPGFGESAALPDASLDGLVQWLRALLDVLEQSDTVIVGSFVGALVARLFAAAEPTYVPALILVDGGTLPRFPAFVPPLVRLPLIGDTALSLFGRITCSGKTLDRMIYVHEALTDDLRASWHKSASGFTNLMRTLVLSSIPEKQTPLVPTLILWGANDSIMPLADGERLKKDIPGAVLEPVADCGHMPQLEASEAFVFQITAFLDKLTRGRQVTVPGVAMLHPN